MKAKRILRIITCVACLLAAGYASFGTHLRAGEITVERLNCNALTFRITITVFTNTRTEARFGGDRDISYLDFGDETSVFVPQIENSLRLDLDPEGGIGTATFSAIHTYSSYQQYTISYKEPNRNEGVNNMFESVNTLFYIETMINLDPYLDAQGGGCSSSPRLRIPPIDKACKGAAWSHNPGAFDPDLKDSISYEMVIPNRDKNLNVVAYKDPNDATFYTNYSTGNEDKNGPPTFKIDTYGTITWNSPGLIGEYNIAFVVKEWREIDGVWYNMGFVRRDMQIVVEDCDNKRPVLIIPNELCVEAGTLIHLPIRGTDPDGDDVKIEAFSQVFEYPPAQSPAKMIYPAPNPGTPRFMQQPAEVRFQWQTECLHVKEQPYQVNFKITDNPPPAKGAQLATFGTWTIKVVGPAPRWRDAVLNPPTRSVDLSWAPYTCANAERIIVYRRVDSFPFVHAECETGLPAYAGYEALDTLDLRDVNDNPVAAYHDDHDLSPAAKYCYRLVAVFPAGVESYVSDEICVGPLDATAPVITNVSIEKTSTTVGEIFVRWTSPFDLDEAAYPRPYSYKVYRGDGFAGPVATAPVFISQAEVDTSFVDTGLNTEENVYHYQVVAYTRTGDVIDTSMVASSVRAEARSLLKQIELNWSAQVPWSNQISTVPFEHLIYRGPEGSAESDLVLIASVDSRTQGFTYVDGVTTPLQDNLTYCYRIMTRGGYGNPQIEQPLENFSQMICAQPGDENPPCKPAAPKPQGVVCDDYIADSGTCGKTTFSNVVRWDRPEDLDCRNDIAYYNLYAARNTTSEYVLLASKIRTTQYEDINLPSHARCYKISSVDRSGNESEQSDPVCFDNCPYYELPNVFTPNTDDCNRRFSAYSGNDRYLTAGADPETPELLCGGVSDISKCARFVERVIFRVYNRWGKEVYSYIGSSNDDGNSIYLDWDGRSDDGADLASGVYYYVAEVTFSTVDLAQKQKTLKGWVHLIR